VRLLRLPIVTGLALFLAIGVMASYRAYYPVSSVRIVVAEPTLRPGSGIQVDTVCSGRGPVTIRVDLVQGDRVETAAIDRVSSRGWPFWDIRVVKHSTYAVVSGALLQRLDAGPAIIRATVEGAPAWLRQPPAVVREVSAQVQGARQGAR